MLVYCVQDKVRATANEVETYGLCLKARTVVVACVKKLGHVCPKAIADALNDGGYVNRTGQKWRPDAVRTLR